MSYLLHEALKDLATILGNTYRGSFSAVNGAAGSSASSFSSIGDADLATLSFGAGYWKAGTLFMPPFTTGGTTYYYSSVVGSGSETGSQIPLSTALTPATPYPDNTRFMVLSGAFPRYAMINAINDALREYGRIVKVTTTPVVISQESYTCTAYPDVRKVEVSSGSAVPYEYKANYNWRIIESATRQIEFDPGYFPDGSNMLVRITYLDEHDEVVADMNEISAQIVPERLKWTAAEHICNWRYQKVGKNDPGIVDLLNRCAQKAAEMRMRYPIYRPDRITLLRSGRGTTSTLDDVNKVRL